MGIVKEFWQADEEGVKLMTLTEEKRISFDEFITRLQRSKISTPILPHGTIWYESNNNEKVYVIQLPPRRRTIPYFQKFYDIGFPSIVALIKLAGSHVVNVALAATVKPINNLTDVVLRLPLPNMDDRGILCLGSEFDRISAAKSGELDRIRETITYIETSKYNDHLLPPGDWIPKDIRGSFAYAFASGSNTAKEDFHGVLERWAILTAGDDWLKVVEKFEWIQLSSIEKLARRDL